MDSDESGVYRVQPNGMRLINTKTLELQKFPEGLIPPYAILSHVWGDEHDECRFQDFSDTNQHSDELKAKKGYAKIVNFCGKAQEDGHAWAWADTVCIDKTNYEELNTAINCMFSWYQQSEVCFVYLEDVEYCGPTVRAYNLEHVFVSGSPDSLCRIIAQSSWFKRGWTLQELIAPARLSFFSRGWSLLFARSEVRRALEKISNVSGYFEIPRRGTVFKKCACPPPVPRYTVAAKMQWASRRHTRYPEDKAYCLLGIFGVQMPIQYGEGARAFKRLQSLIVNVTRDPTLLIWSQTTAWSIPHGLMSISYMADSPSDFMGTGDYYDFRVNLWLDKDVTRTAIPSGLETDFILYKPLIRTLHDDVSLMVMGRYQSPCWFLFGDEGDIVVPVTSAGNSKYRRVNLPIMQAEDKDIKIIHNKSPTKLHFEDISGAIIQDIPGSCKTGSNGGDLGSIVGPMVLVIFPLGLGGYSFLAAFPGLTPSAPGMISMANLGPYHCAVLVLEDPRLQSRIGFVFLAEAGPNPGEDGPKGPTNVTCRVLKEPEIGDVSKDGLQTVAVHHINFISLAAQKHTPRTQALWRKRDRLGQFYAELGHFRIPCSPRIDESCENRDEKGHLVSAEESTSILTAQLVLDCPKTEVLQKIADMLS